MAPKKPKTTANFDVLANQRSLMQVINKLNDEEQVLAMIEHEKSNKRRVTVLLRLHGRYTTLRCKREKAELFGAVK